MKPLKKIEIVTDSIELRRTLRTLEETLNLSGYTLIKDTLGMGEIGTRLDDELTDVIKNSYVMLVCPEEQADEILGYMEEVLDRFGGICLVSDVQGKIY